MGIDTAGQPSCKRFLARYSGAGASIAGAECLAGRIGLASDFPSYEDTYNLLRSTLLEFDVFDNLKEEVRRNGGISSLSERKKISIVFISNCSLVVQKFRVDMAIKWVY